VKSSLADGRYQLLSDLLNGLMSGKIVEPPLLTSRVSQKRFTLQIIRPATRLTIFLHLVLSYATEKKT
jgi:hypothetical protein